ncbi:DUF4342 domain-containing protein [Candidatus Saccharibacteria bacterium oral taxon 488]|nr:DUF4342 domain-containing protein [Candidatus Saccharibacteria bacterium oral taxon 488]
MSKQNYTEEFSVNGDQVVEKVKQLIKEGNVRRLLLPTLAALGAAVALMAQCTIAVERRD